MIHTSEQFVQDCLIEMSRREEEASDYLKPVTVRLKPDTLILLDRLAKLLEVSRQRILSEAVSSFVNSALSAYAQTSNYTKEQFFELMDTKESEREGK